MDPDANLIEQREIVRAVLAIYDACADDGSLSPSQAASLETYAGRLAELVQALDEWLTGGGFLPSRWERRPLGRRP